MKKFLLWSYPVVIIGLLIYSYTQVDLNLTLFRHPIWLSAQRSLQDIGYFQRGLSAIIFLLISGALFAYYFGLLKIAKDLSGKNIWFLVVSTAVILTFSYNAFSYDLFNYIFDAKIVTAYGQNPYEHRALDYPNDPMLLFMHWTHRLYPYGPTWLAVTVPFSFLGMGIFIPTFYLFKALITAFFLGTVYFIGKIIKNISPANEKFGLIFFALNPLVIIESLVSSHNDIAMVFFMMLAFYFLQKRKIIGSIIYLLLSIGIKFATIFLAPVFAYIILFKKNLNFEKFVFYSTILMFAAALAATLRLNFQPWYWLFVLPLISLIPKNFDLYKAGIVISIFGVLYYIPYLYYGNFDAPVPSIIFWLVTISIILSISIVGRKLVKI